MATDRELTYTDLTQAARRGDPQFADLVVRYLEQPDPPEDRPEEPPPGAEDQDGQEVPPLPQDAWTLQRLRSALSDYNMMGKTAAERKALRAEAWQGLLAAPHPPPRLRLGLLLVELYEGGQEHHRAALVEIITRARLCWGLWQGLKRIYKLAEQRHDAAIFGALAWRLDASGQTPVASGEISRGTLIYLTRRAWRYLRQLGAALPEIYPQFAAQVLRHYPRGFNFYSSWVANQIWDHEDLIGQITAWSNGPPKKLSKRAFDEAWKISAEPLLRLLEDAQNDGVCDFAIRSLQEDFPETLRQVDPRWLARIGAKPLASVHEFVIKLLSDSPEFHQSKLAGLGLHETVLGLLGSDSAAARAYAVDYARAHAPQIEVEVLLRLATQGAKEVKDLALARLTKLEPAAIGLTPLCHLLGVSGADKLAQEKIRAGFSPADLQQEQFITLITGTKAQTDFVKEWFKAAKQKVPAAFYCALLEDSRCAYRTRRQALEELGQRKGAEIGLDWIKQALMEPQLSGQVAGWLRAGLLGKGELDVEWLKGLVLRPNLRPLALELLANPKLVSPGEVGLSWLLALARQADESLNQFAHGFLLEHFTPKDFAATDAADRGAAGLDKLWSLAAGAKEPESVRSFAAAYLKVHHPELGPTLAEARSLGIQPRLSHEAYDLARVRPLFFDARSDVRRLAGALGRQELVRWNEPALVYELAAARYREPRALAAEALLEVGQPGADPKVVPPARWLEPGRVFALAESPLKATREIALTLIRRHYATLGGAQRLAWLMESPDREVRLFAVRLLWERHRPRALPPGWKPARGEVLPSERFDTTAALQLFLRTVMFGLPPGGWTGVIPRRARPCPIGPCRPAWPSTA